MTRLTRLVVAFALLAAVASCSKDSPTTPSPVVNVPYSQTDLRVGTGAEAATGRRITANYSGWLYSATAADNKGTRFDAGLFPAAGQPPYLLGSNGVIAGWERGIPGMRVGGLRRLVIPPDLGYGARAVGTIPPNSTLLFEVELLSVQ